VAQALRPLLSARDEIAWVEREEGARELWLMNLAAQ
jgi:hypothetical protein